MIDFLYGKQPVLEALNSETAIEKIFVIHGNHSAALEKIRLLARRKGIPVVETNAERLREFSSDARTQGIVALTSTKAYVAVSELLAVAEKKQEQPLLLILDEIEDPHNLGALIRTAECAGVHGLIVPKHHSASINETVAKTSAGASAHMPVARVTNIAQTIDELKSSGVWIAGSDTAGNKAYYQIDYTVPLAIVIGNEGKGIRRLVKEKCDFLVNIPMYGKIGSLNASVSGALLMFEAAKARHEERK
jgi:23S rRNA (guanosine2251-2'-O)-methyltransferase